MQPTQTRDTQIRT